MVGKWSLLENNSSENKKKAGGRERGTKWGGERSAGERGTGRSGCSWNRLQRNINVILCKSWRQGKRRGKREGRWGREREKARGKRGVRIYDIAISHPCSSTHAPFSRWICSSSLHCPPAFYSHLMRCSSHQGFNHQSKHMQSFTSNSTSTTMIPDQWAAEEVQLCSRWQ